MSVAFTTETTIARPATQVWDSLVDWNLAPQWMSSIESITADGPVEPGTHLSFTARGKTRPSIIAEVERGTSLVLRSVQGGVTADYTYTLTPIDGANTTASLTAECQTQGVWKLVGPLLRMAMKRSDSKQLDSLRDVLLAQPSA